MKGGVEKKKKVFVGMSGGVDSSVSAGLLAKQGYDVTGVFIKVWEPNISTARTSVCTWREDRRDAMRVAAHLGIPFVTIDLGEAYKRNVVDYMIREYREGRTPNPDVMCNKMIKFGAFFEWAISHGADIVATGHYARVHDDHGVFRLYAGIDANKDQSYFLWTLAQEQLSKTLFPVGELEKSDVRKVARTMKLPNAEKKDSQGLCFIGKLDMREFLRDFIPEREGKIVDEAGEVIGTHYGAHLYTIGQRHGFVVTKKSASDTPYYVVGKDIDSNRVTVSHDKTNIANDRVMTTISLCDTHWITKSAPEAGEKLSARVRYRQPLRECVISYESGATVVTFNEPQLAALGQSVVIYRGDECLGGGVIG